MDMRYCFSLLFAKKCLASGILSLSSVLKIIFNSQIFAADDIDDSTLIRLPIVDFLFNVPTNAADPDPPRCGYIFNGGIFGCSIRVGDDTSGRGDVPIISCGS